MQLLPQKMYSARGFAPKKGSTKGGFHPPKSDLVEKAPLSLGDNGAFSLVGDGMSNLLTLRVSMEELLGG